MRWTRFSSCFQLLGALLCLSCCEGIPAVLFLPRWNVSLRIAEFLHTSLLILSLGRGTAGHSDAAAGCLFVFLPTGEVASCLCLLFITNALVTFLTGSAKHSAVKHLGYCLRDAVPRDWKGVAQAGSSGHFTAVVRKQRGDRKWVGL